MGLYMSNAHASYRIKLLLERKSYQAHGERVHPPPTELSKELARRRIVEQMRRWEKEEL